MYKLGKDVVDQLHNYTRITANKRMAYSGKRGLVVADRGQHGE